MPEVPPTDGKVQAALNAIDGAPAESRKEAVDHHAELRLLTSGLRDDQSAPLRKGKETSSDAVRAAHCVVVDGDLGSTQAQQGWPATEDAEFDALARLPVANEPTARAYDFAPVAMAEVTRAVLRERHHRTGDAYPLFGRDRAVGVAPFHRLEAVKSGAHG